MNILKKINKMRIDRGWSIYRLSVESGISQSTLTNMFNRETLPSITTLECICNAFGITMSEFFAEEKTSNANTFDETELIKLFNNLNEEDRDLVIRLMHKFAEEQ